MLSLQNFTKNSSHGWGDLFVSDIHVRRSVVTSAVDWHCEIYWIFWGHNIPNNNKPDDKDGSISLS